MERATALTDGRGLTDRRAFTWRTVLFGFVRSRRRDARRETETEPLFTDWHHPWLFLMSVGTMLLSAADAFLTLQLLQRGAIEANPVMAALLSAGTSVFAITKMAMTASGVLALVYLARCQFLNRMRTGLFLTLLFVCYACLVAYELLGLMHLNP